MNQHDAQKVYQEAGRLFAEKRYADAIQLFDQLAEAFPTNADVVLSQAKCLAELGRNEEAASTAQFLQDSLKDPRGGKLLQTLPQETFAPPDLPTHAKESKSRRFGVIALALVIVVGIVAAGYFFLMPSNVDSDETTIAKAEVEKVVTEKPTPPVSPTTVSAIDVPEVVALLAVDAKAVEAPDASQQLIAALESEPDLVNAKLGGPTRGRTPLSLARSEGVAFLAPQVDAPAPAAIEKTPGEVLIALVKEDKLSDAVELLRDNRELSNTLDFENRPVLTHAKSVKMAELLVEAGADAEVSSVGWTPLMWIAGRNGSPEVAKYLIELGAWVSIEDDNGMRPIHQAAFMGNHDLVQILVANGADINAIDDTHVTPLHGAAWSGDLEGVKMYLSLGADRSLENKKGATPYDLAQSRENEALLPLLNPEQTEMSEAAETTPDDTQVGTAGSRDLNFPDDIKLGTVQIRDWGSTDYKAWESAGSAWGTVTVPVGKEVMLMVDVPRLESLASVDPEGIQVIHIRNLKLADEQLENLYRLKGLRKLTLSKTGVSKAAVEALRAALPECSVRH